jgi:NUMOD3 motif
MAKCKPGTSKAETTKAKPPDTNKDGTPRKPMTEAHKKAIAKAREGSKQSAETKAKISAALKGKKKCQGNG